MTQLTRVDSTVDCPTGRHVDLIPARFPMPDVDVDVEEGHFAPAADEDVDAPPPPPLPAKEHASTAPDAAAISPPIEEEPGPPFIQLRQRSAVSLSEGPLRSSASSERRAGRCGW